MSAAHAILLASAGTGKTYRLVHRVLGLLLDGAALDGVLASTFTRKAAGQILERVLQRLADAARHDEVREDVARELGLQPGGGLSRQRCLSLLGRLVRQIHSARISTLDAWFMQAVSLQALELGLPPGWSLATDDEDAELRSAAVNALVHETDEAQLSGLLADLRGSAKETLRGVHAALLDLVAQGHELLRSAQPGAFSAWSPAPPMDDASVQQQLQRLIEWPLPTNKGNGRVPAHWANSHTAILDGVQAVLAGGAADTALLKSGLLSKVLAGESSYSSHPITTDLHQCLLLLARRLGVPLLDDLCRRTRSREQLLSAFGRHYQSAKRVARRYRFDDLPVLLGAGEGPSSDTLAFRGLSHVQHLLLDEFQDTSLPQWLVLSPLVQDLGRTRDGSRSLFCVGDIKQSIYGWRGGEPRLLSRLGPLLDVVPETLPKNFRSAQVVLDTAAAVLGRVAHWPELQNTPALAEAAARWDSDYPEQHAARDLPGQVSLWEAGNPDDPSARRFADVIERAADLAAEAAAAAPHGTVGVLTRSNKAIPRILHALRRRGVAASGEGGNAVTDSEAVQVALSALHLADHPGDGVARLHLATSALGAALGLRDHTDDGGARRLAREIRAALLQRGTGALLTEWQKQVQALPDAYGPWDRRRFAQLVEQAAAFDDRAGLRPSAFVASVRVTRVEDPDASRVKVMTVHAAKGLEFHAVVLPELHSNPRLCESSVLVGHDDPLRRPDTVVTGARKELLPLDDRLQELADQTWGRNLQEFLCQAYVGLTRAMRRMDLVVPVSGKRDVKLALAQLLRAQLAPNTGADAQGLLWRAPGSVDHWADGIREQQAAQPAESPPVLSLRPASRGRTLPSRSPSSLEGGGAALGADLLAPRASGALDRGTVLHAWLERITWLQDGVPDDEALLAAARAAGHHSPRLPHWLTDFRAALARPEIAALLSRPDDGVERVVSNERAFALRLADDDGAPFLLTGSMDRMVQERRDGAISAVQVIDWKSDSVADDAALAERVAYYRPQLAAYRRAAAALTGVDPAAVRCRLAFVQLGRVIEV